MTKKNIQELSKELLKSYRNSAEADQNIAGIKGTLKKKKFVGSKEWGTMWKRHRGLMQADHKVRGSGAARINATEETDMNIQEISNEVKQRYIRKAVKDVSDVSFDLGRNKDYKTTPGSRLAGDTPENKKKLNRYQKRRAGIDLAAKKLTKEETMTPTLQVVQKMRQKQFNEMRELVANILSEKAVAKLDALKEDVAQELFQEGKTFKNDEGQKQYKFKQLKRKKVAAVTKPDKKAVVQEGPENDDRTKDVQEGKTFKNTTGRYDWKKTKNTLMKRPNLQKKVKQVSDPVDNTNS